MRKRLLAEWIELLLLLAMTGCNESAHAQTDCLMSELLQTIKNRDKYLSKKENRQKELLLAEGVAFEDEHVVMEKYQWETPWI